MTAEDRVTLLAYTRLTQTEAPRTLLKGNKSTNEGAEMTCEALIGRTCTVRYRYYNLSLQRVHRFTGPGHNTKMEKRNKLNYIFHKRLLGQALLKHRHCILQFNQVPTGQ